MRNIQYIFSVKIYVNITTIITYRASSHQLFDIDKSNYDDPHIIIKKL